MPTTRDDNCEGTYLQAFIEISFVLGLLLMATPLMLLAGTNGQQVQAIQVTTAVTKLNSASSTKVAVVAGDSIRYHLFSE